MIGRRLALLALLAAIPGARLHAQARRAPAPAPAPVSQVPLAEPVDLSDEGNEGIGDVRVENEAKINVPDSLVERVWRYMNERYVPTPTWIQHAGERFGARASDEYFTDVYYDTPDMWFLRHDGGLRHRTRHIPGDVNNRKNNRELMQVKLQRENDFATSRSEIKFDIRHYPKSRRRPDDNLPALGIVKRSDRPAFLARLASLGIDGTKLRQAITIEQRRRRVYLFDESAVFFSLTLDQTSSRKWWMHDGFTEIELEINELAYTPAGPEKRHRLEEIQAAIEADLYRAFPSLGRDQTPKYSKLVHRFEHDHALFPLAFRLSLDPRAQAGVLAGALVLVVAAWGVVVMRASRKRRPLAVRDDEPSEVRARFLSTTRA